MTIYTVKTHKQEADAIARGDKMYIMRKTPMTLNARIFFEVIEDGKKVQHPIDDNIYVASYIDKDIQDGITLVGIKRLK